MPDYADPTDAAVRRFNLGQEIRGTDVLHDPNYLIATAQNPNPRIREAAILRLHDLYRQQELGQRDQALAQRYGIAQQALAQRGEAIQQGLGLREQALGLRESGMQQRFGLQQDALDQRDIHFQANQRRLMAHDAASEAHHQLTTDRNTEIDEQGHGLLQTMLGLDGALRRGEISKDQYDEGLLQAGQQFPLGTRHPEAARHYEFAITEADKQNAFNARRELTQVAKIGAKYGIEPQFDPETGRPSIELTQQAALQTPKGRIEALGYLNKEMAQKYGITTGVGSLFNPIAPHFGTDESGTAVENPTHVALPFFIGPGPDQGKVGHLPVPKQLFDQMKADFNDRYFALNPSAQTAGAVPTTSSAAPVATVRLKAPDGSVRDVSPDMADHYQQLGATIEQ